ncbi:NADH-quinone oxidoreductase subunit A [Phycicoccus endophyticus]|uniref:NADH-quinone oxidoreductase subunit n=1 Tax=Phycicoccus endophyticus TaxID=1690220 RepID=A0A7G9QZG2_9MICO|nr:NADH-quinone oxidoreductase subunit A [Phycicoccus endophyticus]NHI19097.1 NAD(P)H-quinone oxidoreductase subunit 3 [Phycicoccus endophyticus]QNN48737.1 NADH-quinone oxidoreductase subunit A [Phycicoccus endophyticus]GGL32761.1 NADH-quinone oxidoreductase subunit [Phycicoccus endophyticus]
MEGYLVVAAVVLAGVLLVTAAMAVRRLLAPRAATEAGLRTYESGVDPVGAGWAQSQVRYLSFAFLYVVFAVDAVYLFPWALVLRDAHLGAASLVEVGIFVGVLLLGLVHAGRRGLLRWETG